MVGDRFPPVHYYPNEHCIVINIQKFKKDFLRREYRTHKNNCFICKEDRNIEIHHIIPIVDLGNNKYRNLIPICHECHMKIHNNTLDVFFPKKINHSLIKKSLKLQRKYYNINKENRYRKDFFAFDKDFVDRHIGIDGGIKDTIKWRGVEEAKRILKGLHINPIIKST
jgi:hypothetical protein